jgi:hypothetical protein
MVQVTKEHPTMQTLSELDLMQVNGGKKPDAQINSGTTSSAGDDAILTALNNISSSLKDIGKNNNGLFGNNGLLFMTMALALSNRGGSNTTVIGGGGGGCCGPRPVHARFHYGWRGGWW